MLRKLILAAAAAAALGALGLYGLAAAPAASAATAHTALTPPPPCSGVYIDDSATQQEIAGNGVNQPVTIVPNGNCFSLAYSGTWNGYRWYAYQNGDGRCLFDNGGTLDLGGACHHDTSHPNEEQFGVVNHSDGWTWSNPSIFYDGGGAAWGPNSCAANSRVSEEVYSTCDHWLFP